MISLVLLCHILPVSSVIVLLEHYFFWLWITATSKSILGALKLDISQKITIIDTVAHRRNNLLAKFDKQILIAEAMLKGEEYFNNKTVKKTDEDGNISTVTEPKQVRKWFYENNGQWFLEIKYGNKVLQLAKDKTAIIVGKLDDYDYCY